MRAWALVLTACFLVVRIAPAGVALCVADACPMPDAVLAEPDTCCCTPDQFDESTAAEPDCCLSIEHDQPEADPLPAAPVLVAAPAGTALPLWLCRFDAGSRSEPVLADGSQPAPRPSPVDPWIRLLL